MTKKKVEKERTRIREYMYNIYNCVYWARYSRLQSFAQEL